MSKATIPTKEELVKRYGLWGQHPRQTAKNWQYEVANGDTRLGYWDWVIAKLEAIYAR